MSSDQHARIVGLLEDYALGELARDEQRDVEAHLHSCAVCAEVLRDINEALTLVADTVPAVAPPPSLKGRVLASVAAQPQERAREQAPDIRSGTRWQWLAWAAAVLVAVGLSAMLYRAESRQRTLSADLRQSTTEANTLRERLQRFSNQTDLALSILTAADMRELPLAGRDTAVATAARAYWSPTRGLLVVADRLPAPPPGRIYQVWIIERGQPLSAGLLGDQSEGRGMLVAPPPRPGAGAAVTVAVTDEPPGGLTAPSGTIRLAGSI